VTDRAAGTARVEGARELRRALKQAGEDLEDLKDANQAAAKIVLAEADRGVPRKSGALARSGRTNRAAGKANVLYGNARVPYAPPIHWGWAAHGIEPNPWVSRAALASQPEWLGEYSKAVQRVLDKIPS
jgi:hypothetical protein